MNDPIKLHVIYGQQPTRWQRFKWFCSRNWYVPLCVLVAVLVAAHMRGLLATFVVSFLTAFFLVTVIGSILR